MHPVRFPSALEGTLLILWVTIKVSCAASGQRAQSAPPCEVAGAHGRACSAVLVLPSLMYFVGYADRSLQILSILQALQQHPDLCSGLAA